MKFIRPLLVVLALFAATAPSASHGAPPTAKCKAPKVPYDGKCIYKEDLKNLQKAAGGRKQNTRKVDRRSENILKCWAIITGYESPFVSPQTETARHGDRPRLVTAIDFLGLKRDRYMQEIESSTPDVGRVEGYLHDDLSDHFAGMLLPSHIVGRRLRNAVIRLSVADPSTPSSVSDSLSALADLEKATSDAGVGNTVMTKIALCRTSLEGDPSRDAISICLASARALASVLGSLGDCESAFELRP